LARLALLDGRVTEAEQHSAAALYLSASAENLHLAGQVAAAAGRPAEAVAYFDRAFDAFTLVGDGLSARYATEVARRRPLPASMLPCLRQPYNATALVALTRDKANLLRRQGDDAQAVAAYRRLLALLPSVEIQAELDALCREQPESCAE
jgi:tetratricopeptide (TPR) repeat protein